MTHIVTLGNAEVGTNTGGIGGAFRYWALRTQDITGIGQSDLTPWEGDAGTQITLVFRTGTSGITPPSQAQTVILRAYKKDGTLLKEFHNGAPPANSTQFTLDLTDTGNPGGVEIFGGIELYVRAIFDGVSGDYDVDSRDNVIVGNTNTHRQGLLRANPKVTAIVHGGYPAGANYAIGPTADENITVTVTHTRPLVANEGQFRIDVTDGINQFLVGTAQNIGLVTSTQQQFLSGDDFLEQLKSYGIRVLPIGDIFLPPTSGTIAWAKMIAADVSLVQDGDNVRIDDLFSVDPSITVPVPTIGQTLYNSFEVALATFNGIQNSRAENLTRALDFELVDAVAAVQEVVNTTGPVYNVSHQIQPGETAIADDVGAPWRARPIAPYLHAQTYQNIYNVSSLYLVDVHTQLDSLLVPDDFPTDDASEDHAGVILGNTLYTWVHVENIRNDGTEIDTTGNAITLILRDQDGSIQQTYDLDTSPDSTNGNRSGWTARLSISPGAPPGDWTYTAVVNYGGNTGEDVETITHITPLTSNLFILPSGPILQKPGQDHRITVKCEIDNAAGVPESLPIWRLFNSQLGLVSSGNCKNIVDDTETIDGAIYYVEGITDTLAVGRYTIWVEAQLNGNPIKQIHEFRVAANSDFDLIQSKLGAIGPP